MTRSLKAKDRNKKQKEAGDGLPDHYKNHLTMQQEARNTEGRGIWRTGVSLRHRTVQFVCAQDSRLDQEIEPPSPNVTEDICTEKAAKEKPCHPTDISLPGYQGEFNDLVAKAARVVNPDSVTSSLQTSTDSSEDEIVFRGRRKDQDWKLLSTSSRVQQSIIGNNSTPFGGIQRGDLQSPPAKPGNEFFSISDDAFDPTPDREDVTYFPLNLKKQKKEGRRTMDENDALADYIANIDEEYLMPNSHSHSVETLGHDIQASDPAMPIASLNSMSSASMKLLISHDDQSPPQRNDRSTIQEGHGNRNVGVSGCQEDREHTEMESFLHTQHPQSDADSNASSGISDTHDLESDESDASDAPERNFFASATSFAKALESDPYYGFDIMDFNRPSLRKQSKGKGRDLDAMISDSGLDSELVNAWRNDRRKKKFRKQQREQLRAQGLLGRARQAPDLKTKYANGIDPEDLKEEIRQFLQSPKNSLALPSMAKQHRKLIHELANSLYLNSQSRGKGSSRFPIIHKTSRTPPFTPKTVGQIDRILSKGRLGQRGFKTRDQNSNKTKPRRARPESSVSYLDGEVVGGSAPEIGAENRGRAMLEKMGWSTGTPLGAINNKGILLPVAHVVKNSRAGLG